jgi:hypothetical protein
MKQKFKDAVALFGGTARYSGRTETPVLSDKEQHAHVVQSGKERINARQYRKKLMIVGHYAGKKLLGMTTNEPTMFVHGMDEATAIAFHAHWGNVPVPFNVVFQ